MNIVSELHSFLPLSLSCSTHQWRTDIWLMLSQTGRPSSPRGSRKLWKQKEYVVIKADQVTQQWVRQVLASSGRPFTAGCQLRQAVTSSWHVAQFAAECKLAKMRISTSESEVTVLSNCPTTAASSGRVQEPHKQGVEGWKRGGWWWCWRRTCPLW